MTRTCKPARSARLIDGIYLRLTIGKEVFGYWLSHLEHQFGQRVRCYRLEKFQIDQKPGEPDSYDVVVTPGWDEGCQCECKGYLKWNHCKHISSLLVLHEAGKLV